VASIRFGWNLALVELWIAAFSKTGGQNERQPGAYVGDGNPVFATTVGLLAAKLAGGEMGLKRTDDLVFGGEFGVCCRKLGFELKNIVHGDRLFAGGYPVSQPSASAMTLRAASQHGASHSPIVADQ